MSGSLGDDDVGRQVDRDVGRDVGRDSGRDSGRDVDRELERDRGLGVAVMQAVANGTRLCATITRREARNFYYGLRLLPPRERSALYVVYAWMRVVDDIADADGASEAERRGRLDRFEARTRAAFGDRWHLEAARAIAAAGPSALSREQSVCLALWSAAVEMRLPIDDFLAAIEGQRMDLAPRACATFAETELYCDRVASTVGRICLDVWGVRPGADPARARALSTARGIAFQLTNVLRDVREDLARGRCYLPADELAAHGLSAADLVAWRDGPRCSAFMEAQCARAARYFDESSALEGLVSPTAVPTLAAMSVIYRRILARIARDPEAALARRVSLSAFEKVSIALRARLGALSPAGGGRG